MPFDNIKQSRILTLLLSIIGLWPVDFLSNNKFLRYYPFYIHLPISLTFTLLIWLEVILTDDMSQLTLVLNFALTETAMFIKLASFWWNARLARQILRDWETDDIYELHCAQERTMWQKEQRSFGIVSFLYITCSISAATSKMIAVLFMDEKELAIPFWVPFDRKNANYYWYAYVYDSVALICTCTTNISLDMFNCYLMLHMTLCLRVVGMRMEKLGREATLNLAVLRNVINVIQLHQAVKSKANECERVVSYAVLGQVILSAFVLCCSIYSLQSVSFADDPGSYASMLLYISVMTLQIFLPCYYANEITLTSEQLLLSLYSGNWMDMSPHNRRLICIHMQYLGEPIVLRASIFFDIGLPIFSKTMNNAYSLLALLLNIDN